MQESAQKEVAGRDIICPNLADPVEGMIKQKTTLKRWRRGEKIEVLELADKGGCAGTKRKVDGDHDDFDSGVAKVHKNDLSLRREP